MSHRKKNSHLNELPAYTGQFETKTRIHYLGYSPDGCFEKQTNNLREIRSLMNEDRVSWVRVFGMNDAGLIIELAKIAGLNVLDAKDILTTQHIMTIEEYEKNIFVILPVLYTVDGQSVVEQVALICGKNYLISIQESDHPLFESIYHAIQNGSYLKFNNRRSDFLMASIFNEVISYYSDEVIRLENNLEDLEDQLLDIKQIHNNLIPEIQEKRRSMIRLRKLLFPFKSEWSKLLRADPGLINEQEIPYFKDIYDQMLYILQNLESCREILSSLVDLYLNNNDVKMNVVMKQLTLVATIFIPLTFLAGVWGMNFKFMPELDLRYGYLCAWLIMIAGGTFVWWYLKRKDWL
ncbi:MAG: magnesium/cobalt transporter CorA [Tannerella sp.]|jgi:magnesium transporter|nr:magnesium/cobalt transporter CorA [Tannerella sp.]